jgi:phosphoribosylanthranilate isomerase
MIKVKICGVTNPQDALWAANLGADYIGLNFYAQSPRKVSAAHARDIASQIPPFTTIVGVFVDEDVTTVAKLVKTVPLKAIQLHGSESPAYCQTLKELGVKIIKVFRLQKPLELADLEEYAPHVDFYMFDHYSSENVGGTGEAFDWEWLKAAAGLSKPWFLAGGLKPDNVSKAIKQVQPPAVDVCSGVERLPKRKDYDAMKNFIQTVKAIR